MHQRELPIFYSFRFLCSIMVFLFHARVIGSVGGDFVTFFIVLSGFFAIYTFRDTYLTIPYQEGFKYLLRKLKKFYPIHIVAFVLALPLSINTLREYGFQKGLLVTLAYNTYTQSFIPMGDFNFAFNGVEWTMSVLCFCYLMTPLIVRFLQKIPSFNAKRFCILLAVVYLIEFIHVSYFKTNENCVWYCSINPFFRIFDYFVGCALGYWYKHSQRHVNTNRIKGTIIQLVTILVTFIMLTQVIPQVNTAYRWSLIMMPLSVLIIWIFAFRQDESLFNCLFNHPILVELGKISYEIYMLHLLILNYMQRIGIFSGLIYVAFSFVITLVLSFVLHSLLSKKITYKRT